MHQFNRRKKLGQNMDGSIAGRCLLAVFLLSCMAGPTWAGVAIHPTFVDAAGASWNATQRGVINQVINEWEAVFADNHTIDMTFTFKHFGTSGPLGLWNGSISTFPGTDLYPYSPEVSHTVRFNADLLSTSSPNYLWWDPTPTTSNDQPFVAWDALTVVRHELTHALGFTGDFYVDDFAKPSEVDKWESHMTGTIFDPGGLNVSMTSNSDLAHVADSGVTTSDLMIDKLVNNTRRSISEIDKRMLALAYGYTIAASLEGDFDGDGDIDGDDFLIWQAGFPIPSGATLIDGDADSDGDVDGDDFLLWQNNFLFSARLSRVPEPGSLALLAVGVALTVRRMQPTGHSGQR